MSWFSSRGSGPRKEQGRVQTAVVEPDVHRSLALAALCEEIRRRKLQVLDLGSAKLPLNVFAHLLHLAKTAVAPARR
jgi:hypothetical protein